MANAITRVITWLGGVRVGEDPYGNIYYRQRNPKARARRWVIYAQGDDASHVPPEYHAWLHHTVDQFPDGRAAPLPWQRPHQPNRTGTPQAWRPQGHALKGGQRPRGTGDYQPWSPE